MAEMSLRFNSDDFGEQVAEALAESDELPERFFIVTGLSRAACQLSDLTIDNADDV